MIQVILDLTDPNQGWVRVTGPNVSWHSKIRPLHAEILQRLANRPDGLTPDELCADLPRAATKTTVSSEISKLRNDFGGLLHPPGDNRYRLGYNITVNIQQSRERACDGRKSGSHVARWQSHQRARRRNRPSLSRSGSRMSSRYRCRIARASRVNPSLCCGESLIRPTPVTQNARAALPDE